MALSCRGYNHSEVIEAVFRRTRVTVGIMTAAKLLSAVEPVIRYQRGGSVARKRRRPDRCGMNSGCRLGEDSLHRLVDVWATGEASASLGFAAARAFDELDPLEREADKLLDAQRVTGAKARAKYQREASERAADLLRLPAGESRAGRTGIRSAVCVSFCWIRWPTCFARQPSCGIPAGARR